MKKIRAVALTGATATGKSSLAMQLAASLDGEIVAMDSMQIYRRMDIGTAKPTLQQRQAIPHHMLDIVEPDQNYTVAQYSAQVLPILRDIESRGKLPLLVGGTGLYLKALLGGMSLGGVGENAELRKSLTQLSQQAGGCEALHKRLSAVDPASGQRLHPNDVRRVIRAIEIYELTGVPASQSQQTETEGDTDMLVLALHVDRPVLRERLSERVDQMLEDGLAAEVKALLSSGVREDMQSMQAIGYKQMIPFLRGECSLEDARWQIILATRHYAKRQETFLKSIHPLFWIDGLEHPLDAALANIHQWMGQAK